MLKNLKQDNIKLLANFSLLAVTQGINLVLPVIIMPFLIRIIGVEKFGVVILAQTSMTQFHTIIDYGFNVTATKYASINRDNSDKLIELFNRVITTKLLLTVICFCLLSIILLLPIKDIKEERMIFYLSFGMVIGKMLFPVWFFQGIEKMKYMTLFNLVAKIILVALIIIFIRHKEDYIYINLFWSIGDIFVGIGSLIFIKKHFGINIKIVDWQSIKEQLADGWPMFLTNMANNIYINSNILILGFFCSSYVVGLYGIAERIMQMGKQIASIMLQATYPHACKLAENSFEKLQTFFQKELVYFFCFFFAMALILTFGSNFICDLFSGREVPIAAEYLRIISFVPLIVSLNMPAYQMMVIHDLKEGYVSILVVGAIFNLVFNFIMTPIFGAIGTSLAVIATEVLITISFHVVLFNKYSSFRLKYF